MKRRRLIVLAVALCAYAAGWCIPESEPEYFQTDHTFASTWCDAFTWGGKKR